MSAATGRYVVEIERGHGLNLRSGKILPTVQAVVRFADDGMIAVRLPSYYEGQEPRNMAAVAGKSRKRWQTYYDQTGRRFEIEQRDEKLQKAAVAEAEKAARFRVRAAAPELLAAAQRVVAECGISGDAADALRAAIDKAVIVGGAK